MPLLREGTRVGSALVVDKLLGEGAYAEVYRVRHEYLGWQAMKVFKQVASVAQTRRMLDEARLLSRLGHRNVVRLFDAGTLETADGRRGYFTMEYVAGGSIDRLVRAHGGAVPVDIAVTVMQQVADGLAVAHGQDPPVLHRDLTPANVLVGYDGSGLRVRVSDFGLAKRADAFTLAASAQGTVAFMAPEVFDGGGWTRAGDVWAIGCLGYLLLTNRLPYTEDRPYASFSPARFRRRLLAPSAYHGEVVPELDALVVAALDVDPRARPADAGALAAALRSLPAPEERNVAEVPARSSTADDDRARALLVDAKELARTPGGLGRAADLLEEAVSLSPAVRATETVRLTHWRRGVIA